MGKRKIIPKPPRPGRGDNAILVEVELPELAVVLWQIVRHVRDWQESSLTQRAVLFRERSPLWVQEKWEHAVRAAPDLGSDLRTLQELVAAPLAVLEKQAAAACEHIARWAEARALQSTAILFAELAAAVDATEPRHSNLAGRLTRNAGDYERAEAWLERGIGLGRRNQDWVEYTRGHLSAGIMCMQRGLAAPAKRHLHTASTIAMREGHEWLAAEAQHDLFHFMTIQGSYLDAELHARRALAWYPKHHQRLPFFAADVAFLLICEHRYSAAIGILKKFVRLVPPPQSVLGMSILARALACAGRRKEFDRISKRLVDLLAVHTRFEAAARWNLAHALRALELWDAAEQHAAAAAQRAHEDRDEETESFARELLAEIAAGTPSPPEDPEIPAAVRRMVREVLGRLRSWSPTRKGRARTLTSVDWTA